MNFISPLFLSLCILISTGCAGYMDRIHVVNRFYESGDYDQALHEISKIHPSKRDRLLYYLDKGTIEHSAALYADSISSFNAAIDLSEVYWQRHLLVQGASIVTSDNLLPYTGAAFEQLYMHVFQILNYVALNKWEEAAVDVRRINTLFPDRCRNREDILCDSFHLYLSAIVWEATRHYNDAYIDYKAAANSTQPLLREIKRSGLLSGIKQAGKKTMRNILPPKDSGELVLVIESGRAPIRRSSEYQSELQVFPIPVYEERDHATQKLHVWVDGHTAGAASSFVEMGELERAALKEEMPAIIARAIARLAAKEGAAIAVGKEVDRDLGILLGILVLATNEADLRSWSTLPKNFQIWRGYLPEGEHTIHVSKSSPSPSNTIGEFHEKIYIKKESIRLLTLRTF